MRIIRLFSKMYFSHVYMCLFTCVFVRSFMIGGLCKSRESDGILPLYAGIWSRH